VVDSQWKQRTHHLALTTLKRVREFLIIRYFYVGDDVVEWVIVGVVTVGAMPTEAVRYFSHDFLKNTRGELPISVTVPAVANPLVTVTS
jgi:hypothetical protein